MIITIDAIKSWNHDTHRFNYAATMVKLGVLREDPYFPGKALVQGGYLAPTLKGFWEVFLHAQGLLKE